MSLQITYSSTFSYYYIAIFIYCIMKYVYALLDVTVCKVYILGTVDYFLFFTVLTHFLFRSSPK